MTSADLFRFIHGEHRSGSSVALAGFTPSGTVALEDDGKLAVDTLDTSPGAGNPATEASVVAAISPPAGEKIFVQALFEINEGLSGLGTTDRWYQGMIYGASKPGTAEIGLEVLDAGDNVLARMRLQGMGYGTSNRGRLLLENAAAESKMVDEATAIYNTSAKATLRTAWGQLTPLTFCLLIDQAAGTFHGWAEDANALDRFSGWEDETNETWWKHYAPIGHNWRNAGGDYVDPLVPANYTPLAFTGTPAKVRFYCKQSGDGDTSVTTGYRRMAVNLTRLFACTADRAVAVMTHSQGIHFRRHMGYLNCGRVAVPMIHTQAGLGGTDGYQTLSQAPYWLRQLGGMLIWYAENESGDAADLTGWTSAYEGVIAEAKRQKKPLSIATGAEFVGVTTAIAVTNAALKVINAAVRKLCAENDIALLDMRRAMQTWAGVDHTDATWADYLDIAIIPAWHHPALANNDARRCVPEIGENWVQRFDGEATNATPDALTTGPTWTYAESGGTDLLKVVAASSPYVQRREKCLQLLALGVSKTAYATTPMDDSGARYFTLSFLMKGGGVYIATGAHNLLAALVDAGNNILAALYWREASGVHYIETHEGNRIAQVVPDEVYTIMLGVDTDGDPVYRVGVMAALNLTDAATVPAGWSQESSLTRANVVKFLVGRVSTLEADDGYSQIFDIQAHTSLVPYAVDVHMAPMFAVCQIVAGMLAVAMDAMISGRLALEALSAADVEEAVLDAILSHHAAAGSVGAALAALDATVSSRATQTSVDAIPASIWNRLTSALTTTGSIGAWLLARIGAVKAKTDTIGAADLTAVSPVLEDGDLEIVQSDDYMDADGRALEWTDTAYTGPIQDGDDAEFALMETADYHKTGGAPALTKAGTAHLVGTTLRIVVELTAAETAALEPSPPDDRMNYTYQVRVDIGSSGSGERRVTAALGAATVKKKVVA